MSWYVVRTNIKCEDKAARNLAAAGFETYVPWQHFEVWNRRKNRLIENERRLAPRCLFLRIEGDENVPWGVIRACEGVEYVLSVEGRPIPLNGYETRKLLAVMAAARNLEFDEKQRRFCLGDLGCRSEDASAGHLRTSGNERVSPRSAQSFSHPKFWFQPNLARDTASCMEGVARPGAAKYPYGVASHFMPKALVRLQGAAV